MEQAFRIFDFNVYNEKENPSNGSGSEEEQEQTPVVYKDNTIFKTKKESKNCYYLLVNYTNCFNAISLNASHL